MAIHSAFPTLIYSAALLRNHTGLNQRLLRECLQLRLDDAAGRRWSEDNYPGGYTSYNSVSRMHTVSPTFATLERYLDRHVRRYAGALQYDLTGREFIMTDCWVNIMPRHVMHGLHLHPLATISGTYYVQTPRGAPGLKFEDPRLDRFMAVPPKVADAASKPWMILPVTQGQVLLFESWLRHEVPPNPARRERISISFNYSWF